MSQSSYLDPYRVSNDQGALTHQPQHYSRHSPSMYYPSSLPTWNATAGPSRMMPTSTLSTSLGMTTAVSPSSNNPSSNFQLVTGVLQQQQQQHHPHQRHQQQQEGLSSSTLAVRDWLGSIEMDQYFDVFLAEGFDRMLSIRELQEDDLRAMGVKRGHRRVMFKEIARMQAETPFYTRSPGPPPGLPPPPNLLASDIKFRSPQPLPPLVSSTSSLGASNDRTSLPQLTPQPFGGSSHNTYPPITSTKSTQMYSIPQRSHSQTSLPLSPHAYQNTSGGGGGGAGEGEKMAWTRPPMSPKRSLEELSHSTSQPSSSSKRRYRRHPKSDPFAPEKPVSAYVKFSNQLREELQDLSFSDIARTAGERWRMLDPDEKEALKALAVQAKSDYVAAVEAHKLTPEYEQYQRYLAEFNRPHPDPSTRGGHTSPGHSPAPSTTSVSTASTMEIDLPAPSVATTPAAAATLSQSQSQKKVQPSPYHRRRTQSMSDVVTCKALQRTGGEEIDETEETKM